MSNITKCMSKNSRDVIFSEKKAPAGMPTHRTGVDNTKNPYSDRSICNIGTQIAKNPYKIYQNLSKLIKINEKN